MVGEIMSVLVSPTLRDLVNAANVAGVPRDKVVTVMRDGDQFVLVYYA